MLQMFLCASRHFLVFIDAVGDTVMGKNMSGDLEEVEGGEGGEEGRDIRSRSNNNITSRPSQHPVRNGLHKDSSQSPQSPKMPLIIALESEDGGQKKKLKNLLLTLIVILSMAMLIFTSSRTVEEYLSEPITVETTFKTENDHSKFFPDVIICSHRIASLQKMSQNLAGFSTGIEDMATQYLADIHAGASPADTDPFGASGVDLNLIYNNILWHSTQMSYHSTQTLKQVKISRDEFVIDCQIKNYGAEQGGFIDCVPYMTDFVSNEYAICQKLMLPNALKKLAGEYAEATYGLRINVFLNTRDTAGQISPSTGVRVTIQDPDYPVVPQNDGIDVGPGTALSIVFNRVMYRKKSRDTNGQPTCVEEAELRSRSSYDDQKGVQFRYNEHLCDQFCTSQGTLKYCGCVTMHFFGDTICDKAKVKAHDQCIGENYNNIKGFIEGCHKELCHPSCSKAEYQVKTNQAMFPSDAFLPVFISEILSQQSNISSKIKTEVRNLVQQYGGMDSPEAIQHLRNEFIHLHFYRESKDTMFVTEKDIYTKWSLVSNLGGNMGMFLGLSLVGFFKVMMKLKKNMTRRLRKLARAKKDIQCQETAT